MSAAPDEPTPVALGAAVTAAREAAGRSVADVAQATRIRGTLVLAIEAGDFAPCGGAVYARGHLRSIAQSLGVDARPWIASYDRFSGATSSEPAVAVETPAAGPAVGGAAPMLAGRALGEGRQGPRWGLAMAGVLALVIVVAAVALALPRHTGGATATSPRRTTTTTATPPVSSPAPPPSAPSSSGATLAGAGVHVTVSIHDQASWVDVTDQSGQTQFEGTVQPGQSKAFHAAQTLNFVFGYAPAVDLVVDGRDIGAPQATGGDVAKASFDVATAGSS